MEVYDAVERAFGVAKRLLAPDPLEKLRLEQVEFSDGTNEWLVTLGYETGKKIRKSSGHFGSDTYEDERVYRVFYIDNNTGALKKMMMR